MQIQKDTVVQFHYRLQDGEGNAIEDSYDEDPMLYLHGHGNIIEGLEAALAGKQTGDKFSVTLTPDQAYGERNEQAVQRIPLKHLSGAKHWKPGMVAMVHTDQGHRQVTIIKVGKFNADVDTNPPLAGKTLTFDVEITDVRAATSEELAHGHAHGVGGHHH